mgnify:CR=1 FL=1
MDLRIAGTNVPESLWQEFGRLTNHATLSIGSVRYERENRRLSFRLSRRHSRGKYVTAEVTVRNVISCEIADHAGPDFPEVDLLFGVTVQNREVFLSSVEEDRGTNLFVVSAKVDGFDVELRDAE